MMRAERVKSAEAGKQSSSDETDPEKMTPLQRMAMVVGTKTNLNDMLKKLEDISPEWETNIAVKTFGIADVQLPILLSRKTEGLEIKTARITGLSNRANSRRAATDKMKASRAEEHGFLPQNRSARGPMAQNIAAFGETLEELNVLLEGRVLAEGEVSGFQRLAASSQQNDAIADGGELFEALELEAFDESSDAKSPRVDGPISGVAQWLGKILKRVPGTETLILKVEQDSITTEAAIERKHVNLTRGLGAKDLDDRERLNAFSLSLRTETTRAKASEALVAKRKKFAADKEAALNVAIHKRLLDLKMGIVMSSKAVEEKERIAELRKRRAEKSGSKWSQAEERAVITAASDRQAQELVGVLAKEQSGVWALKADLKLLRKKCLDVLNEICTEIKKFEGNEVSVEAMLDTVEGEVPTSAAASTSGNSEAASDKSRKARRAWSSASKHVNIINKMASIKMSQRDHEAAPILSAVARKAMKRKVEVLAVVNDDLRRHVAVASQSVRRNEYAARAIKAQADAIAQGLASPEDELVIIETPVPQDMAIAQYDIPGKHKVVFELQEAVDEFKLDLTVRLPEKANELGSRISELRQMLQEDLLSDELRRIHEENRRCLLRKIALEEETLALIQRIVLETETKISESFSDRNGSNSPSDRNAARSAAIASAAAAETARIQASTSILKREIDVVERQVVSAVEERDACLGEIARLQDCDGSNGKDGVTDHKQGAGLRHLVPPIDGFQSELDEGVHLTARLQRAESQLRSLPGFFKPSILRRLSTSSDKSGSRGTSRSSNFDSTDGGNSLGERSGSDADSSSLDIFTKFYDDDSSQAVGEEVSLVLPRSRVVRRPHSNKRRMHGKMPSVRRVNLIRAMLALRVAKAEINKTCKCLTAEYEIFNEWKKERTRISVELENVQEFLPRNLKGFGLDKPESRRSLRNQVLKAIELMSDVRKSIELVDTSLADVSTKAASKPDSASGCGALRVETIRESVDEVEPRVAFLSTDAEVTEMHGPNITDHETEDGHSDSSSLKEDWDGDVLSPLGKPMIILQENELQSTDKLDVTSTSPTKKKQTEESQELLILENILMRRRAALKKSQFASIQAMEAAEMAMGKFTERSGSAGSSIAGDAAGKARRSMIRVNANSETVARFSMLVELARPVVESSSRFIRAQSTCSNALKLAMGAARAAMTASVAFEQIESIIKTFMPKIRLILELEVKDDAAEVTLLRKLHDRRPLEEIKEEISKEAEIVAKELNITFPLGAPGPNTMPDTSGSTRGENCNSEVKDNQTGAFARPNLLSLVRNQAKVSDKSDWGSVEVKAVENSLEHLKLVWFEYRGLRQMITAAELALKHIIGGVVAAGGKYESECIEDEDEHEVLYLSRLMDKLVSLRYRNWSALILGAICGKSSNVRRTVVVTAREASGLMSAIVGDLIEALIKVKSNSSAGLDKTKFEGHRDLLLKLIDLAHKSFEDIVSTCTTTASQLRQHCLGLDETASSFLGRCHNLVCLLEDEAYRAELIAGSEDREKMLRARLTALDGAIQNFEEFNINMAVDLPSVKLEEYRRKLHLLNIREHRYLSVLRELVQLPQADLKSDDNILLPGTSLEHIVSSELWDYTEPHELRLALDTSELRQTLLEDMCLLFSGAMRLNRAIESNNLSANAIRSGNMQLTTSSQIKLSDDDWGRCAEGDSEDEEEWIYLIERAIQRRNGVEAQDHIPPEMRRALRQELEVLMEANNGMKKRIEEMVQSASDEGLVQLPPEVAAATAADVTGTTPRKHFDVAWIKNSKPPRVLSEEELELLQNIRRFKKQLLWWRSRWARRQKEDAMLLAAFGGQEVAELTGNETIFTFCDEIRKASIVSINTGSGLSDHINLISSASLPVPSVPPLVSPLSVDDIGRFVSINDSSSVNNSADARTYTEGLISVGSAPYIFLGESGSTRSRYSSGEIWQGKGVALYAGSWTSPATQSADILIAPPPTPFHDHVGSFNEVSDNLLRIASRRPLCELMPPTVPLPPSMVGPNTDSPESRPHAKMREAAQLSTVNLELSSKIVEALGHITSSQDRSVGGIERGDHNSNSNSVGRNINLHNNPDITLVPVPMREMQFSLGSSPSESTFKKKSSKSSNVQKRLQSDSDGGHIFEEPSVLTRSMVSKLTKASNTPEAAQIRGVDVGVVPSTASPIETGSDCLRTLSPDRFLLLRQMENHYQRPKAPIPPSLLSGASAASPICSPGTACQSEYVDATGEFSTLNFQHSTRDWYSGVVGGGSHSHLQASSAISRGERLHKLVQLEIGLASATGIPSPLIQREPIFDGGENFESYSVVDSRMSASALHQLLQPLNLPLLKPPDILKRPTPSHLGLHKRSSGSVVPGKVRLIPFGRDEIGNSCAEFSQSNHRFSVMPKIKLNSLTGANNLSSDPDTSKSTHLAVVSPLSNHLSLDHSRESSNQELNISESKPNTGDNRYLPMQGSYSAALLSSIIMDGSTADMNIGDNCLDGQSKRVKLKKKLKANSKHKVNSHGEVEELSELNSKSTAISNDIRAVSISQGLLSDVRVGIEGSNADALSSMGFVPAPYMPVARGRYLSGYPRRKPLSSEENVTSVSANTGDDYDKTAVLSAVGTRHCFMGISKAVGMSGHAVAGLPEHPHRTMLGKGKLSLRGLSDDSEDSICN